MGNERARMIFGGALSGGAGAFLDRRERERIDLQRQEEIDREDRLLRERNAREDKLDREERKRQRKPIQKARGRRREQRGRRQDSAETRDELRELKQEDRPAFLEAGGRSALRRAAGGAKPGQERPVPVGRERAQTALEDLRGATTSAGLQDAVSRIKGTPEAKRPAVRKQLEKAPQRIKDFLAAEEVEQTEKVELKGTGTGAGGAVAELSQPDWQRMFQDSSAAGQSRLWSGVESHVARIQKKYAPMVIASTNMLEISKDPEAVIGPKAIAMLYQFLRSQDNSVVRASEIKLFESGTLWTEQLKIRYHNLVAGIRGGESANWQALAQILSEAAVGSMREVALIFRSSAEQVYDIEMGVAGERYEWLNGVPVKSIYDIGDPDLLSEGAGVEGADLSGVSDEDLMKDLTGVR